MNQPITITLQGEPRGKGRPRGRIVKPKNKEPFILFYPDDKTEAFEKALKWLASAAMRSKAPLDGPLKVRVVASMSIPASWSEKKRDAAAVVTLRPTGKPDADNFLKIGLDALNKIVWNDDAQVVEASVVKVYAERPSFQVQVEQVLMPLLADEPVLV